MRRRATLVLALLLLAAPAGAEEECAEADPRDCPHTELALTPIFGLNSDTGVALGAFLQLVRFEPKARPYDARLQVQASVSFLGGERGLELPYHNHFVQLDLPAFPGPAHRLYLTAGYLRLTREGYYGVGNRSVAVAPAGVPDARYSEYLRRESVFRAALQSDLGPPGLRLQYGLGLARPVLTAYDESRLAEDRADGEAPSGVGGFWQTTGILGVLLDRRDHEVFPTRGFFGDVLLRAVPGGLNAHEFLGATATGRLYVPVFAGRAVLAMRLLGDVLAGDVPLNELGRYGGVLGNAGLGGSTAVRGVPLGRFIGKTKVLGNLELRTLFLPFKAWRQRMVLGAAAFADAGRVWSGAFGRDAGDGRGLGLHTGYGAGLRLRWGDAFLLRADVAVAPGADASGTGTTLGLYMTGDAAF